MAIVMCPINDGGHKIEVTVPDECCGIKTIVSPGKTYFEEGCDEHVCKNWDVVRAWIKLEPCSWCSK